MQNLPRVFQQIFGPKPAETLVEAMIALVVLVVGTTATLSLIRSSVTGNEVLGEKMIALNLAQEGLEGLENLRDTNLLRFGGTPECAKAFNMYDGIGTCDLNQIQDGVYYAFTRRFEPGNHLSWDLEEIGVSLDDNPSAGTLQAFNVLLPLDDISDGVLFDDPNVQIYLPRDVESQYPDMDPVLTPIERSSIFRRYVQISTFGGGYDAYIGTVTVEWLENGITKSVEMTQTFLEDPV